MDSTQNPGALAGATGANYPHQSTDKGTCTVSQKTRVREAGTPYLITPTAGDPFRIGVSGRNRWALENLRQAGPEGCTPILNPAPRWSYYVHQLRELGVDIETVTERHEGRFPGTHGQYVLRCGVVLAWKGDA